MNPRRGLKKHGLRGYEISGPMGTVLIDRENRRRWRILRPDWHPAFELAVCPSLREARLAADWLAGNKDDLELTLPRFLDRRLHPKAESAKNTVPV